MIKREKVAWLILGASALALVVAVGMLVSSIAEEPMADDISFVCRSAKSPVAADLESQKRNQTRIATESIARAPNPSGDVLSSATNAAATAVERDETEELMDEVVREIMAQLQDAVKKRDFKSVLALAEKLRILRYGANAGGGGGSASAKRAILGALAECGIEAIPAIVRLINDSDVAIAREATSLVFKTLLDVTLSDSVRADIVVEAASEMTDTGSLIRLYNEFIKMRHSVGADALVRISNDGTDEAKKQLPRVISAFTGNAAIKSADQLEDWLPEHPDSAWDDTLYGGFKLQGAQLEVQAK